MGLLPRSNEIIDCIRAALPIRVLLDKDALMRDIGLAIDLIGKPRQGKQDEKRWADECVIALAVIYKKHTGRKIGFTNGETETRFERFVRLVIVGEDRKVSRNLVKAAIRRMHHDRKLAASEGMAGE